MNLLIPWLNPGVRLSVRANDYYNLMVNFGGIAFSIGLCAVIMALNLWPLGIMAALSPIPRPYPYK